MTPHEKAVSAVNARLERLQANLREAQTESSQRTLFQSIVVMIGLAEALSDYIKSIGSYAQRRHGELKQTNEALTAQHAELLKGAQELLEKFKAAPADRALRKEIERAQQNMAAIQKTLRRGVNGLQRELAPSLSLIDEMSVSVRRLSEADQPDELKRVLKTVVGLTRDLYAVQEGLPGKDLIDAAAWESAAKTEIEQASDFYDAFARAGHHATLALELMAIALSDAPPQSAEDAARRAGEALSARLKAVTSRLTEV